MIALYCTVNGGLKLFFPIQRLPGGGVALGVGEEIVATLHYLIMMISFIGGIGLVVNGIRLIRRERLSAALALPIAFGVMGLLWPLLYFVITLSIFNSTKPQVFMQVYSIVSGILLYAPGMLAAVMLQSLVYAILRKPKTADYILVLGAGLRNGETVTPLLASRLNRGIRYYEAGDRSAVYIVSGGQGSNEKVSEAFAMKQYLLDKGIPDNRIILEDKSTTTEENIRFSKTIMDSKTMDSPKSNYTCVIATSNYHVLRAVILAKNYGLNAQGVGSRTALYYLPAAFIREYIAIIFRYKKLVAAYIVAVLLLQVLYFYI
ncbi:membrane protein [Clostridia bacterium]|nr:membrane protein [Clostridia bacterium]